MASAFLLQINCRGNAMESICLACCFVVEKLLQSNNSEISLEKRGVLLMKSLSAIKLSSSERAALTELKKRLSEELPGLKVILYGSKARGDSIPGSDIDLLVLVEGDVTPATRIKIRSIKYSIELKYDVIISLLIETVNYWQSIQAQAMPLHWNIDREGVPL